jgi:hypothetical protein
MKITTDLLVIKQSKGKNLYKQIALLLKILKRTALHLQEIAKFQLKDTRKKQGNLG